MSDLVGYPNCCFSHAKAQINEASYYNSLICLHHEMFHEMIPNSRRHHNAYIKCLVIWIACSLTMNMYINPYLTSGFSNHYQLDESTFIFRGVRSDF